MTSLVHDPHSAWALMPSAVAGDVSRPRLLSRLTAAMDEPWTLTVLSAPAGTGKTRLLGQWADVVDTGDGTAVVWWALQRDEVDLEFLRTALEALDDERVRASLARVADTWSIDTARALARCLRVARRRTVIIIDDVHLVETEQFAEMLSAFVNAVPGNAHVVLSGRGTGRIPLARRRIAGIALELDAKDLAFTPAEVRSFFRARGVSLSQGEITSVLRRTEGWATGLRLLELAAHHDSFAAVLPLRGDSPTVTDYFVEEVFADLDHELGEFLVLTAIPESFTPQLASRLTGGAPAAGLIDQLLRLNVLISRNHDEPGWYHYHPLLREFLYSRLKERGDAVVESLEKKAAEWFAAEQNHRLALAHATRSHDAVSMSRILRQSGMQLLLMGHACEVITATADLPRSVLTEPSVQLLIASARLARGDASTAAALLESSPSSSFGEASAVVRQWRKGLELHVAVRRGGLTDTLDRLELVLDEVVGEAQLDTYVFLQAAMAELYVGNLDRAGRFARFASDHALTADAAAAELQAAAILNTAELFRGRMGEVLLSGARLDQRWVELGTPDDSFYEVTRVWRYWVPFERMLVGDVDETLKVATDIIESGAEPSIARGLRGMLALLGADSAIDAHAAAIDLLDNLAPRADMPLPVHWYAMMSAFAVRAFNRLGERSVRDRFIVEIEKTIGSTGDVFVLRAIAALHDQEFARARQALAPVLDGSSPCLLPASMVDAWLVAACIEVQSGHPDQAQVSLAFALALAEPEELVRRFADAGPVVARLLAARATPGSRGRFADCVRERLAAAGMLIDEELTRRERIVLSALSRNATLREIAQQEFISPNTVKTHVRNIYRKLGVSDRDGVTAAAHALGIE
ncbi:LuxR C-terminal-related transcriptional regulator [Microbacterium sp. NPDC091662]|uniref:LuxR C-terminal-related transcriptional regulator n=1 Tax=Microbacterium sp. NPDC091662 TaxID=3364211 RepID=UPI003828AC78